MRALLLSLAIVCLISESFAQESIDSVPVEENGVSTEENVAPAPVEEKTPCVKRVRRVIRRKIAKEPEPEKRWYFTVGPGYFYFTDAEMRTFYGDGGVTFRGEFGYRFWGPFTVWVDGGYFQKDGESLGIYSKTDLKIATITLGLKTLWYLHERVAFYLGAGPRLFMMMMNNSSPFVRSEDNGVGIGAGFDGGFWLFPIPQWKNFFLNLCADYSWKQMDIEEDEVSSIDESRVDLSGVTGLVGLGIRF